MKNISLDRRLMAAAEFVRPRAVVADIGTDHAYLPVFLVKQGIAARAVASDINEGPVLRAKKNVSEAGLSDKIEVLRRDGLCGYENSGVTDIIICGMGGELIAQILGDAKFTANESVRLILQPMTKAAELRRFLVSSGYSIIGEKLAEDDGKIYQIICAEYSGTVELYTEAELLIGKSFDGKDGELFIKLAEKTVAELKKRKNGLEKSGRSTDFEDAIIKDIEKTFGGNL